MLCTSFFQSLFVYLMTYVCFLFKGKIACQNNEEYRERLEELNYDTVSEEFFAFNKVCVSFSLMGRMMMIISLINIWTIWYKIISQ